MEIPPDLVPLVPQSGNASDICIWGKSPQGKRIKDTENPTFKEMHLVTLEGGGEIFKVKPALIYHR